MNVIIDEARLSAVGLDFQRVSDTRGRLTFRNDPAHVVNVVLSGDEMQLLPQRSSSHKQVLKALGLGE